MRSLILLLFLVVLAGCARFYTPYEAASSGGKHCSKRNSVRW